MAASSELETFAQALGRTRAELERQIDEAENPQAERRKLARRVQATQARVERDEEARELDGFAEDGRERLTAIRSLTDAEIAQARARMTLGAQLDQALADAALLTGVEGSNMEGSGHSSGKLEGRGPGRIAGALYEPALDVAARYRVVCGQLVSNLQREVDSVCRRPLTDERRLEGSKEKDARLLRDWEGIPSHVVSTLDASFGSPRSVETMRRRNGRRPIDGTEPRNGRPVR